MAEECRASFLLGQLAAGDLREVAVMKMEGYSNEEIAAKLGCVPRTIEPQARAHSHSLGRTCAAAVNGFVEQRGTETFRAVGCPFCLSRKATTTGCVLGLRRCRGVLLVALLGASSLRSAASRTAAVMFEGPKASRCCWCSLAASTRRVPRCGSPTSAWRPSRTPSGIPTGSARRIVLDDLGNRYKRHFADQWESVHFAKDNLPDLDLNSPRSTPRRRPPPADNLTYHTHGEATLLARQVVFGSQ